MKISEKIRCEAEGVVVDCEGAEAFRGGLIRAVEIAEEHEAQPKEVNVTPFQELRNFVSAIGMELLQHEDVESIRIIKLSCGCVELEVGLGHTPPFSRLFDLADLNCMTQAKAVALLSNHIRRIQAVFHKQKGAMKTDGRCVTCGELHPLTHLNRHKQCRSCFEGSILASIPEDKLPKGWTKHTIVNPQDQADLDAVEADMRREELSKLTFENSTRQERREAHQAHKEAEARLEGHREERRKRDEMALAFAHTIARSWESFATHYPRPTEAIAKAAFDLADAIENERNKRVNEAEKEG